MSRKEVRKVNKLIKGVIIEMAVVLAVAACIYNPCHLFTAAVIFAFGLECEPLNESNYDIC